MKKIILAILLASSGGAFAATPVQQMIFNVDAAAVCSKAAAGAGDLAEGSDYCTTALKDPVTVRRAALLANRGIIKARLGDNQGALADYNAAIAVNPELGDAYVSRAGVLLTLGRYDEAVSDANRAMQFGTSNMAAAYYSRGAAEDERGQYDAAYRDYRQAVTLKPDYTPAAMQLSRFKVTTRARTAAN
jgi:tetratricopeptide (TPR) repeat protein